MVKLRKDFDEDRVFSSVCDCTKVSSVENLGKDIITKWGKLDIVVESHQFKICRGVFSLAHVVGDVLCALMNLVITFGHIIAAFTLRAKW